MYGVVLWSDDRANRAVIWCEDHGDLAFYRGAAGDDSAMAAGDLIEFDLREERDVRLVDKPRLVTHRSHPTLDADLRRAGACVGAVDRAMPSAANSAGPARIVPFERAGRTTSEADRSGHRRARPFALRPARQRGDAGPGEV